MAAEIRTDVTEGNPSSESDQGALADGLMQIFKPAVEELDDKVVSVRYSVLAQYILLYDNVNTIPPGICNSFSSLMFYSPSRACTKRQFPTPRLFTSTKNKLKALNNKN